MKTICRNFLSTITAIAIAIGLLFGTATTVEAKEYTTDIHFLPADTIFKAGDIADVSNCISDLHLFWSDGTSQIKDDSYYTFISQNHYKINFPQEITINGISYKNPEWKFVKHEYVASPGTSYNDTEYMTFQLYTENNTTVISASSAPSAPSHQCNFQWVTTVEPQPGVDGLEEYKCISCGVVKESKPIPANMATVKNLYGFIKDAPADGTVTTDFGKLHTISDYLLKKMAERNDVTATIQFEYNNTKLQITFPAGTDYTPVLDDTDTMYGFYGVAAKLGLTVTERQ